MSHWHAVWAFDPKGIAAPEVLLPSEFENCSRQMCGMVEGRQRTMPNGDAIVTTSTFVTAFASLATGRWRRKRLIAIGDYMNDENSDWCAEDDWDESKDAWEYGEVYSKIGDGEFDDLEAIDVTSIAFDALRESALEYGPDGELPDDMADRLSHLRAKEPEGLVVACPETREYLEPSKFDSVAHMNALPHIGNVWGAAMALLFAGDGEGDGDLHLARRGPWAYHDLMVVRRSRALEEGWSEVSDQLLSNYDARQALVLA